MPTSTRPRPWDEQFAAISAAYLGRQYSMEDGEVESTPEDLKEATQVLQVLRDQHEGRAPGYDLDSFIAWVGDINGDGRRDYLIMTGMRMEDGKIDNHQESMGSPCSLIVADRNGKYVAICVDLISPHVMKARHQGWNDVVSWTRGGMIEHFCKYKVYDGKNYVTQWEQGGFFHPDCVRMVPTAFPEKILRDVAVQEFGILRADRVSGPANGKGWCFRGMIAGTMPYYLLYLDSIKAGGRELTLGVDGQPNLFLYAESSGTFARVFQTYHTGIIVLPMSKKSGEFFLYAWKHADEGVANIQAVEYAFRGGRMIGERKMDKWSSWYGDGY